MGVLSDTYFYSFEQFANDIDSARADMLKFDSSEIKRNPSIIDINTIEKLPNGRWNTSYKGIEFECFFHYKKSKILYVFLSGAITGKNVSVPNFARWSWYKFINGSMLNIADPMYRMYEELQLGWYYGNKEINLQQILAQLVLEISKRLDIEQKNIVFVGSSGGGYASITCASYIDKAKSLAINPQMVLREWPYSKSFSEITGMDLQGEDKWHRNSVLHYYQYNKNNTYILFINLRSRLDMKQVKNICETMNVSVKYGLNVLDRGIIVWMYDADLTPWIDYHDVQGNRCMWYVLEQIIAYSDNVDCLRSCSSLIELFNEFYYEQNREIKYWRSKIPNLELLRECEYKSRKIAIWGIGEYAEHLNADLFHIEESNYYHIQCVIDSNAEKKGMYHGLSIMHPLQIEDWKEWFIIITSEKYDFEIQEQLENIGLVYQQDFILYKDLFK